VGDGDGNGGGANGRRGKGVLGERDPSSYP
jgi:hypothetical protein